MILEQLDEGPRLVDLDRRRAPPREALPLARRPRDEAGEWALRREVAFIIILRRRESFEVALARVGLERPDEVPHQALELRVVGVLLFCGSVAAAAVEELPQTLQSGAQLELRLDAFGRGPGDELFGGRRDAELPLRWRRRLCFTGCGYPRLSAIWWWEWCWAPRNWGW